MIFEHSFPVLENGSGKLTAAVWHAESAHDGAQWRQTIAFGKFGQPTNNC